MSKHYRFIKRNILVTAIAAATTITAVPANAQLEEVIVTAQRRAESAQDVPIAITAFDAESLTMKQITGFADMRYTAPSVTYTKANFSGNNFKIRGIGADLVAASSDQGVGIHVNDVPILQARLFETEYYDIEQLAVLRGPQGTLYGRNSTGGALNMTTAKPDLGETFGQIEGQYGDYDHMKIVGHVNIPLGDTFAARFAGIWLERDGYTDNVYTGNDIDGRDQYSVRASFRWAPTENTTVDFMASYFDEDSTRSRSQKTQCAYDEIGALGCLPDELGNDQPNPRAVLGNILPSSQVLGPFGAYDLFSLGRIQNPTDLREVSSELDPTYTADETLLTLEISHDFGEYTLTALAGYQDTEVFSQVDYTWFRAAPVPKNPLLPVLAPKTYGALYAQDGYPISASSANPTGIIGGYVFGRSPGFEGMDEARSYNEQSSIELRLQSNFDGRFNFQVGAFYMEAENDTDYWVISTGLDYFAAFLPVATGYGAGLGPAYDGLGLVSPAFNSENAEYTVDSTALFGELYFELTESLKLTVGMRYTEDEKYAKSRAPLYAGGFQPIGADLPVNVAYNEFEDKWEETTGRVVLDWTVSEDVLVYGSFSRGYKGGGFNPPFNAAEFPNQSTTFEPEFVDAFELGMKSQLMDNTLQANLTAFYYDYADLQVSKIINRTSFNENTDAEIYGFEAEFVWAPDNAWMFNANFSYVHSEVKDFSSVDARDPSGGRDPAYNDNVAFEDQLTNIKALNNGSACVANFAPAVWQQLGLGVGPGGRFSNCASLIAAGVATEGVSLDLDGNQLTNTPEYSFSLGGQYTFDLGDAGSLAVRVDYYWQDDMYARLYNKPIDKVGDWDIWNAQATYRTADEKWYARLYGKNLNDDDNIVGHYFTDASSGNFTNVFAIEPRTFGIAVGMNF